MFFFISIKVFKIKLNNYISFAVNSLTSLRYKQIKIYYNLLNFKYLYVKFRALFMFFLYNSFIHINSLCFKHHTTYNYVIYFYSFNTLVSQNTLNIFMLSNFNINSALEYLDPALAYVSPKFKFMLLFNRTDYMHLYAHNNHVRLVGSSLVRTLSAHSIHRWCFATYPQDTLHKLVYLTD